MVIRIEVEQEDLAKEERKNLNYSKSKISF